MRILYVIAEKKFFHYGEIRHEMTDTTDTLLAEMFKELPADGVIDRKQCKEILSHLGYSLTNKDVSLIPVSLPEMRLHIPAKDEDSSLPACDFNRQTA